MHQLLQLLAAVLCQLVVHGGHGVGQISRVDPQPVDIPAPVCGWGILRSEGRRTPLLGLITLRRHAISV